jgi:hypothetical protein
MGGLIDLAGMRWGSLVGKVRGPFPAALHLPEPLCSAGVSSSLPEQLNQILSVVKIWVSNQRSFAGGVGSMGSKVD